MTETSFEEVDYHHSNNNEIELLMYKQGRIQGGLSVQARWILGTREVTVLVAY